MNQIYKCVFTLLLINFCLNIPDVDVQLAKGFHDGMDLKISLNLTSCEPEFKDFVFSVFSVLENYLESREENFLYQIGTTLIKFSLLTDKCEGSKDKLSYLSNYLKTVYYDPQQFLAGIIDRVISFKVIKNYWGLKSKIIEKDFYDVGRRLGEIISYIINVDIGVVIAQPLFFIDNN